MEFTGERVVENKTEPALWKLHTARYEFLCRFIQCRPMEVLDVACGTGYGSFMMAVVSKHCHIIGVDISQETIAFAKKTYCVPNVEFMVGNAEMLPFPDASFDLIASFETIEHVLNTSRCLREFHRVLTPDGVLLISTPNRKLTSPGRPAEKPLNPFHRIEYTRSEFETLLSGTAFIVANVYGQRSIPAWIAHLPQLIVRGIQRFTMRHYEIELARQYKEYRYYLFQCRRCCFPGPGPSAV